MSLSQEPATSTLKEHFICGIKDITGEPYAGRSGIHNTYGNAVQTSNGAGPHNIQLFVLAADGTVLHCLPGYWSPQDMVYELQFADKLNQVWQDNKLSSPQKIQMFSQLHLAHNQDHSSGMIRRSHMQGFDQEYEAKNRLHQSDTIRDAQAITAAYEDGAMHAPSRAFKTTDEIMHERMAKRAFVPYERFDVAAFCDYGRPFYDKNEDERDAHVERLKSGRKVQRMLERQSRGQDAQRHDNGVRSYRW